MLLLICGITGMAQGDSPAVEILKYENENLPDNGYKFS